MEDTVIVESDSGTLLERALNANAWFSRISGLAMAVFSPWLADFAGIETWALLVAGLGLIGYSLWLASVAARRPINRSEALLAIAGDEAWVVGAILIIVLTDWLTTGGEIALALVSLAVLGFGVAQLVGVVQQQREDSRAA